MPLFSPAFWQLYRTSLVYEHYEHTVVHRMPDQQRAQCLPVTSAYAGTRWIMMRCSVRIFDGH